MTKKRTTNLSKFYAVSCLVLTSTLPYVAQAVTNTIPSSNPKYSYRAIEPGIIIANPIQMTQQFERDEFYFLNRGEYTSMQSFSNAVELIYRAKKKTNSPARNAKGIQWDVDYIKDTFANQSLRVLENITCEDNYKMWTNVYIGSGKSRAKGVPKTVAKAWVLNEMKPDMGADPHHKKASIFIDRLTIENAKWELIEGKEDRPTYPHNSGDFGALVLGAGKVSRGAGLTLRDGSLEVASGEFQQVTTKALPGFIRAESGDNWLRFVKPVDIHHLEVFVKQNAQLTIQTGNFTTSYNGALHVAKGGTFKAEFGVISLRQEQYSNFPRSNINGTLIVDHGAIFCISDPLFTDSTIIVDHSSSLDCSWVNNADSTMSFRGKNTIRFADDNSYIRGPESHVGNLTLAIVDKGTTKVVANTDYTPNRTGLLVKNLKISKGTLDTTGYRGSAHIHDQIENITITDGGVFTDYDSNYRELKQLHVSGTLISQSTFGAYDKGEIGILDTTFSDSIIDLPAYKGKQQTGAVSVGLHHVTINAHAIKFSGNNQVRIGISPAGEQIKLSGVAIPETTSYAGALNINVGTTQDSSFSGFDTVLFVPIATDKSANADKYLNGGKNKDGVFTVAHTNLSDDVMFQKKTFDKPPKTPTLSDLATAGSDLPANLIYVIHNDPTTENQVDISFIDVGLQNHPKVTAGYTPKVTSKQTVDPNTGNTNTQVVAVINNPKQGSSTTTSFTNPKTGLKTSFTMTARPGTGGSNPGGAGTGASGTNTGVAGKGSGLQLKTVITDPNGQIIATNSQSIPQSSSSGGATQVVSSIKRNPQGNWLSATSMGTPMGKPQGSKNTAALANLMTNSNKPITHANLTNAHTLHPEPYASNMTISIAQMQQINNMVLLNAHSRLPSNSIVSAGDNRHESFTANGRKIWLDSGLSWGNVDSHNTLAGFNYNINEVTFGVDIGANDIANLGFFIGYSKYSMDQKETSTSDMDLKTRAQNVGIYGSLDSYNFTFSGMGGVSWGNTKAVRIANTGTRMNVHNGNYDSRTLSIMMHVEYNGLFHETDWRITPEIGIGYMNHFQHEYEESGRFTTALKLKSATTESCIGSVGLNLVGPVVAYSMKPLCFIRWEHDFIADGNREHEIDASFVSSPGTTQTFVGTHRGQDSVSVGLGMNTVIGQDVDISAGVVYTKNNHGYEYGVGLKVFMLF